MSVAHLAKDVGKCLENFFLPWRLEEAVQKVMENKEGDSAAAVTNKRMIVDAVSNAVGVPQCLGRAELVVRHPAEGVMTLRKVDHNGSVSNTGLQERGVIHQTENIVGNGDVDLNDFNPIGNGNISFV